MAAVPQELTEPLVLVATQGGAVTLTLNRPAQFNPLSAAMMTALRGELERIAADASVRVVNIAAAGKAFCPGPHLRQMLAELHSLF